MYIFFVISYRFTLAVVSVYAFDLCDTRKSNERCNSSIINTVTNLFNDSSIPYGSLKSMQSITFVYVKFICKCTSLD